MDKMSVIAFKATNHVLGAATRSTQPDKALTVDDVAADGILLRDGANTGLHALVDKSRLSVALVDYDTRVVYRPQLFAVTEDLRVEQQAETAGVTVAMDGSTVAVALPVVTPSDIQVYVHVTGGVLTEPVVRAVPIARTTAAGSAGLVLGTGTYTVVILAPGYTTRIVKEVV